MMIRLLFVLATCLALGACGDSEPRQEVVEEPEAMQPDALSRPREAVFMVDKSFVKHMHLHADQLDKLRAALDRGDLWEAMTPAFWLSRHDTVTGFRANGSSMLPKCAKPRSPSKVRTISKRRGMRRHESSTAATAATCRRGWSLFSKGRSGDSPGVRRARPRSVPPALPLAGCTNPVGCGRRSRSRR